MKKRLRKKCHRGEFTAYGCSCRLRFHEDSQALRDEFLADLTAFSEARGLGIFGGFSVNGAYVFCMRHRGTLREDERLELQTWLEAYSPGRFSAEVSPLLEVWTEPRGPEPPVDLQEQGLIVTMPRIKDTETMPPHPTRIFFACAGLTHKYEASKETG